MVGVLVGDRAVGARFSVLFGVEPVAPLEGAVRVGGPFVEVADHIVDPVVVRAVAERAGLCHRSIELVETWIVQRGGAPAGFQLGGVERELIEQVLAECDDVQVTAARKLGINRNTLHKKSSLYKAPDVVSDDKEDEGAA